MIEHEKPGNFPCSKRASKASPEPWTFPASVGVRRVGSGRNGSLHNFLVFGMARGASDAKRLSAKIATSDHRKKGKMPRQRLGPSSPSWRSIPFGEGLAETGQTRQRLGVSCDLTRNNGATGEMGKALQEELGSMLSKLFLLLFLQPQIQPPQCNHCTSPCTYP